MPIHDWTRVDAGVFHSFYLGWISMLKKPLNNGLLPPDYYALAEQVAVVSELEKPVYQEWMVAIRHESNHRMIALIKIVSPDNKSNRHAMGSFLDKAESALAHGIPLLLIDLHPPGPRDPRGIHGALWERLFSEVTPTPEKPLTLAAYAAGPVPTAYIEPVAVGDALPDMPLFLTAEQYINVPLETTYCAAYAGVPRYYRTILETGTAS